MWQASARAGALPDSASRHGMGSGGWFELPKKGGLRRGIIQAKPATAGWPDAVMAERSDFKLGHLWIIMQHPTHIFLGFGIRWDAFVLINCTFASIVGGGD